MSGAVLEIDKLQAGYGSTLVIRDASLRVRDGAISCLLGRNGVGKTTLLKAVMGLLPTLDGRILHRGEDFTRRPTHARARSGFAYVPQGREIIPHLTVAENIRLGACSLERRDYSIPDEIFGYFPDLGKMLKRKGGQLSGGQQQQLAIARALMGRPKLLLLDEPTEGIQPNLVQDMARIIRELHRDTGMAVLLIEQKITFARKMAEDYYVMDRGAVVAQGAMAELDEATVRRHLEVS